MLETDLSAIIRTFAERTIGERPALRLNEIVAAKLPRCIKTYLQAEVLRLIDHDIRSGVSLRRIDRASPGIQSLIVSFARSLAYAYTFEREDYLRTLDEAVHFAANYLFRPRWTLQQFLCDEVDEVDLPTIESRLHYIADYAYLGDLLMRILRRRGEGGIRAEELRTLLARVDDQVVQQHSPRELVQLTKPIFTLMLLGDESTDKPIPVEPLLLFFDDKKLQFLRDYLEGICRLRKVPGLSFDELTTLIEDLYAAESKGPPAPAAEATAPPEEEISQLVPSEEPPPPMPEATPRAETTAPPAPEPGVPAAIQVEPAARTSKQVNAALSLTFAGMTDSRKPVELPPLEGLITDLQRKRLVKKVFHRDAEYFLMVLSALDALSTWEETSVYLNDFFQTNELDPFSDDVVEFTDIVQRRFLRQTGGTT